MSTPGREGDMIKLADNKQTTFCDGHTRRSFLRAGFLGLGGLTLPQLLQARARIGEQNGTSARKTSVIYIELAGGPTQFETYDPKPEAPSEYRGPFGTMKTNVPGVLFSELMAEQAKVMDKLAIIRSIHHASSSHDTSSHLTQTGYYKKSRKGGENTFPCFGSSIAKLKGANAKGVPPYVSVPTGMRNGKASFLGSAYNPFVTGGDPNSGKFKVNNLDLLPELALERVNDRKGLLDALDENRRIVDTSQVADAVGKFNADAFDLLTGTRARTAFDLPREKDAARERYGRNTTGQSMLLARRLVEAGVSFVTVRVGSWDDHSKIADRMKSKGPDYDRGLAALVADLYERGLSQDVLVIAMGEFGRTPRINKTAGRDHWGRVMSVLMAGGGYRMGQVIGSSNSKGEVPKEAPYRPENVLQMAYLHLGIDTNIPSILDFSGRPRYLLEQRRAIKELIS
ncbi:MAG: DUF1501 domain-containing protein [Verrucomicrobiota bacterium]|nr:DUF1501 domain-containing protein [Verrucomicrobiota bacterium]